MQKIVTFGVSGAWYIRSICNHTYNNVTAAPPALTKLSQGPRGSFHGLTEGEGRPGYRRQIGLTGFYQLFGDP
jgi:hypothetical protein